MGFNKTMILDCDEKFKICKMQFYFKLMQVKLALMATHFFKNNNNFRRGTKVSNWFPKNFKVIRLVLNSNL
jgi:hypothetical protein